MDGWMFFKKKTIMIQRVKTVTRSFIRVFSSGGILWLRSHLHQASHISLCTTWNIESCQKTHFIKFYCRQMAEYLMNETDLSDSYSWCQILFYNIKMRLQKRTTNMTATTPSACPLFRGDGTAGVIINIYLFGYLCFI